MGDPKQNVLFLCSANSCRSQMAEAFLRHYADDRLNVYSAGLAPADEIHPLAREVMAEIGVSMDGQRPKDVSVYLGRLTVHYLVIVCDRAAPHCPTVWPGMLQRLVWPFDDPAAFAGSPQETLATFRQVRDQIQAFILTLAESIDSRQEFPEARR